MFNKPSYQGFISNIFPWDLVSLPIHNVSPIEPRYESLNI